MMKKKRRKLMSVFLVIVMVLSMIPMNVLAAAKTHDPGYHGFTTFEELRTLVKGEHQGECNLNYNGEGPLKISKSLTIPENMHLNLYNGELIVEEGVTLKVAGHVSCEELVVDGKMSTYKHFGVRQSLDVNGELHVKENNIHMEYPAEIHGMDNITFYQDWQRVIVLNWFDSSEELKNLTEALDDDYIAHNRVRYIIQSFAHDKKYVIDDDITIPEHVGLELFGSKVTISEGCSWTNFGEMNILAPLTIKGELVNEGVLSMNNQRGDEEYAEFNGSLTLSGSGSYSGDGEFQVHTDKNISGLDEVLKGFDLNVEESNVSMAYPGELSGLMNIHFSQEWQAVTFEARFSSMKELKSVTKALDDDYIAHDRVRYQIWLWIDSNSRGQEFVIDENITIPSHVEFTMNPQCDYRIAEDTVVINHGQIWNATNLKLDGTLKNNGRFQINTNDQDRGFLDVGADGTFTGDGEFWINSDSSDLDDMISGMNLDDYDVETWPNDDGSTQWRLSYVAGLIKLGTPKNLTWGIEYREHWDYNEKEDRPEITGYEKSEKPGFISWETKEPDQARAQIRIYRVGESQPCVTETWGFNQEVQPEYRSVDTFLLHDLDSGSYYFTIQSIGDYKEYRNSDVAKSDVYDYVKPNGKLEPCTDLEWEDRDDEFVRWLDWEDDQNSEYVDGYQIQLYFSKSKNGKFEQYGGRGGRGMEWTEDPVDDHFFQDRGIGYYKFRVRALSGDIEEIGNSDWSKLSPALNMKEIPKNVNQGLQDLIQDTNQSNLTPDQIRDAVQDMDTQDLKAALLTDQGSDGATKKLAELENEAGGPANVEVSKDASAFKASDISVVGANLNNKDDDASEPIKLVVDKPEKNHVIPELYNSSVAVKFSMNLENVEDPENLEVPVKISLPIPNSINPDFVVVFHYHADGTHEVLLPYVHKMNGKWYADFVLTNFSDFTMTMVHDLEKVEAKPATTKAEGNIEYYICHVCGSIFKDAEAKKEITLADTVIPKKKPQGGGSGGGGGSSSGGGSGSGSNKKPVISAAANKNLPEYVVTGTWTCPNGQWMFVDKNGVAFKSRWAAVENPYANTAAGQAPFDWFYFDENGAMKTGWHQEQGLWYYLNPASDGTQGCMLIGWQQIDGKWYYLNPVSDGTKGAMVTDAWIDGYYLDANGIWNQSN